MNYDEMSNLMDRVIIPKMLETRAQGQAEYARQDADVLANFKRIGETLDLDPDKVISVYLLKHIDGIISYIDGHKSQREDVTGRLTDVIVYCCLLWASAEDKKQKQNVPL
jgi:hypothetical protein